MAQIRNRYPDVSPDCNAKGIPQMEVRHFGVLKQKKKKIELQRAARNYVLEGLCRFGSQGKYRSCICYFLENSWIFLR